MQLAAITANQDTGLGPKPIGHTRTNRQHQRPGRACGCRTPARGRTSRWTCLRWPAVPRTTDVSPRSTEWPAPGLALAPRSAGQQFELAGEAGKAVRYVFHDRGCPDGKTWFGRPAPENVGQCTALCGSEHGTTLGMPGVRHWSRQDFLRDNKLRSRAFDLLACVFFRVRMRVERIEIALFDFLACVVAHVWFSPGSRQISLCCVL